MSQPSYSAQRSGYATGPGINVPNGPPREYYRRNSRFSKRPRTSTSYRNTSNQYANTTNMNILAATIYPNQKIFTPQEIAQKEAKEFAKKEAEAAAREALIKSKNGKTQNDCSTSNTNENTSTFTNNDTDAQTEKFSIPFTKKSEYIAVAPAIYIKGKTHAERRQFLDQTFSLLDGYTGSSMRSLNSASYYAIFFSNEKDRQSATKIELTFSYYNNIPGIKQIM